MSHCVELLDLGCVWALDTGVREHCVSGRCLVNSAFTPRRWPSTGSWSAAILSPVAHKPLLGAASLITAIVQECEDPLSCTIPKVSDLTFHSVPPPPRVGEDCGTEKTRGSVLSESHGTDAG